MNDDFLFADEKNDDAPLSQSSIENPWRVLVVDDEPDVHMITRLVLADFSFDDRRIEIVNAHSGKEACQIMKEQHDIAMVLLDVVMETDDAGLNVARYIREDLNNHYTRIILRTGQPGQAPEQQIIETYDIDDYKSKTELTSGKMNTLMYAALRSYRDICALKEHRLGLERVIESSVQVLCAGDLEKFASAVLDQITHLLGLQQSALYCSSSPSTDGFLQEKRRFRLLAATENVREVTEANSFDGLPENIHKAFDQAIAEKHSLHIDDNYIFFSADHGCENLLYVKCTEGLTPLDKKLLEIYASNVAITYENILMHDEILETQHELVYMLGEAIEKRSKETGAHVKRVAKISEILGLRYGLSPNEAKMIKLASPLHDFGKIAVPDEILHKPGKHDADEWEIMKAHAQIGEEILCTSSRRILKLGAIIAGQHHERWDGNGYPHGLKGEDIHIAGRITAIADVFDALGSKRCYKEAWALDDIVELIKNESGKQFDPLLVDLLIANLDEIAAVRDVHPD